jgi:hypothetical protein
MLVDPYHTNWHAELVAQSRRLPDGAACTVDRRRVCTWPVSAPEQDQRASFVVREASGLQRQSERRIAISGAIRFGQLVTTSCRGKMRGTTHVERDCY